jgi:Zn-dependent peptidase ImmA (M78 family)/transcriptional regulator with XRE-family HTH domain
MQTVSPPPNSPRKRYYAACNPAMLGWARSTLRLSLEMAAKKIGVVPARLADWEAGRTRPTIPQLRKCAHVYRRPLAAFYLPGPPRDFTVRNRDFRRLPGEPPGTYSPEMVLALRTAAYRREVALELEPETPLVALVGSATMEVPSDDLAAMARRALGVSLETQMGWTGSHTPLNGWKNAVEALGVLVFHYSDVSVEEVRGFSFGEPTVPVIALNGGDTVNGRVFTLVHELAHLYLGDGASCDLGDFTRPAEATGPAESYCNVVAGALLVPRDALMADAAVGRARRSTEWPDAELERLARRFRVSREVVLRRLLAVDKTNIDIYRRYRENLLTLPPPTKEGGGRIPRAVMVVRDVGKPFARMVLDAYHADAISAADVSDFLNVQLKHLARIETRLAGPDLLTGSAP